MLIITYSQVLACDLPIAIIEVTVIVGKFVDGGVGTVPTCI